MDQRLLFLINPHAGKAEIKSKALEVIDLFVSRGWEVTVYTTQRPLHIPEILRERGRDYQLVVCCGGDGTLNETVSGLLEEGIQTPLGYLPAGTVNDFASSLGLSKNVLEAAQTVMDGQVFRCDVGRFEKRYFTYIAAFGAFTQVSYQTPQEFKNIFGRGAYILEGIRRLSDIKSYPIRVEYDQGAVEGNFIFGMVSNSTSVGGIKMSGRMAGMSPGKPSPISMEDGLLEVLLVRQPGSLSDAQNLINTLLFSPKPESEFVVFFRTSKLTFQSPEQVPWTLDGEFGGALSSVSVQNLPRALPILVKNPPHQL